MKNILLFGAGKSASALIDYLLENAEEEGWHLTVVDNDSAAAQNKISHSAHAEALAFDVSDEIRRQYYIEQASIVLSLLPPYLHILIAEDCLRFKKNLITASYIDKGMEALREEILDNKLLFLCEMGLDPGLDHMSAKKMIDDIRLKEGVITSFISHCGGLVAPESDDNPWHYKISWNPRNVVLAGKSGATFRQNKEEIFVSYPQLFGEKRYVTTPDKQLFCWYPNRDSLNYTRIYGLKDCPTFIRTTLRHPDFMYGWKNIIDLKLTDETLMYETDGKTLSEFFTEHLERNHFDNWLEQKLQEQFKVTQELLANLINLVELEEDIVHEGQEPLEDFMMVDDKGKLKEVDMEDLKTNTAATIAFKMHEAKLTLKQLFFLGMDDDKTQINKGKCSAAAVLQFALENKLRLGENDKDMVVMLHEIEYELPGEQVFLPNSKHKAQSALTLVGTSAQHTAMAKTVGLPMGIATKLILNERIPLKGLHIPAAKEVYTPVLNELKKYGITFTEVHQPL